MDSMEIFMPYITVKVPAGVLDDQAKAALTNGICAAAAECEQVPDDPKMRALCVVSIEETAAGSQTFGGRDLSQMLVSVRCHGEHPERGSRRSKPRPLCRIVAPGCRRCASGRAAPDHQLVHHQRNRGRHVGRQRQSVETAGFCRRVRLPAPAASCRKSLIRTSRAPGERPRRARSSQRTHFACPIDP